MKVYFVASLTGKKQFFDNWIKILDGFKNNGDSIEESVVSKEIMEIQNYTPEEREFNVKKIFGMIERADMLVAEISYPSTAVGFEVTRALSLRKKVILFHVSGTHSYLFEGIVDPNLMIVEYTIESLPDVLTKVIDQIKKDMDVRFNFFIPKSLLAQLDRVVTNERATNKSEYIRKLIEKDMRKNKRYKMNVK
jgi:2'-deoxynucleoside 5'-phosphate N-hydrolase